MSQNLKIRRTPKARYRQIQKNVVSILENMLQKIHNCHAKFISPLPLAVKETAVGLIFFPFLFWLLLHDGRKNLFVFKQRILL